MIHGGNVWQGEAPERWLDFSANLRPEGPPSWVQAVLADAARAARYYPDPAMRAARAGLAAYAGVPVECVLPTAGGIEAIDAVCRAGTGRVMVSGPTFGEYARRAAACGRPVVPGGDMRPGDTLFLCNPNNPTGAAVARAEVLERAACARSFGAFLCADEAFADFCPEISCRDRAAAGELVVVGSLTKALCVPGVRLGYLIAAPEAVERYGAIVAPWSLNAFAAAIAAALPEHQSELDADRRRNEERRTRLAADLRALGAAVPDSRANFLLPDFARPMKPVISRLKARGVLVRDCASFGLGEGQIRVAVRTEDENARLISALREAFA